MAHHGGLLPYFLIYTSLSAFLHSIFCYISAPSTSLRQFSGPERPTPTPLLAHVYAVKNIYSSAIRGYAAYNTANQPLYDLAILTFVGVAWLFVTELFVYKTSRWKELVIPFLNAGVGIGWMISMRGWYLSG